MFFSAAGARDEECGAAAGGDPVGVVPFGWSPPPPRAGRDVPLTACPTL